jgi:hypothetical protein
MSRPVRIVLALGLLAGLAALTACQSPSQPPAAPAAPPAFSPSGASDGMPADAPLAAEARWLGELFGATPVQVSGERDGSVRLTVPMKFAFEASAAVPKPPLQAVLDKLALSLKRQPAARLQVAPPAGATATARLAAIRSHLAGQGIATWRVAAAGAAPDDPLWLRLLPPTAGLKRLDDSAVPPRGGGSGRCRPQAPAPRAEKRRAEKRRGAGPGSRSGASGRRPNRPNQAEPAVDGGLGACCLAHETRSDHPRRPGTRLSAAVHAA